MSTKMKISKKILTASVISISVLLGAFVANTVHAADPDAFIVEVSPSSFDTNEAVDITLKAVKSNGDIVKDYQWDVFIEIEGIVDTADYTVPSDGLYTFMAQDQGVKLFSKGLIIKKSWTFTIKVSDFPNDNIMGQKTIIVGNTQESAATNIVTIMSPIPSGIEKNNIANIIAIAPWLPNSPYDIYINNKSVSQGMTNINGDINAYVSGINEWDNILQIKILNANNETIGESETISFDYQPIKDGVFISILTEPGAKITQGEKVNFTVNASESVTSAQIKLSDEKRVPMDKKKNWIFIKEILVDREGNIPVDINLIVLGQTKNYTGVTTIVASEWTAIGKIRMYSDSVDKTKLNVTREPIGTPDQYKVAYGTSQNDLAFSIITQTNEIIIENLTIGETYYFQITPLDSTGNPVGTVSEITQAKIGETISCTVVGITVGNQQIGEKYYLIRSGVINIEKYVIYRSEFETSDINNMQKVWETTGTMFEYPFNKFSKKNEYAYYLVEWVCKDGTTVKIDSAKKIQVGPVENILLIILISGFIYSIYRLYYYSKN